MVGASRFNANIQTQQLDNRARRANPDHAGRHKSSEGVSSAEKTYLSLAENLVEDKVIYAFFE